MQLGHVHVCLNFASPLTTFDENVMLAILFVAICADRAQLRCTQYGRTQTDVKYINCGQHLFHHQFGALSSAAPLVA